MRQPLDERQGFEDEGSQTPFARYPRKPLPHFTKILIPALAGTSGLLLTSAMPELIGATGFGDYAKCAIFGGASVMVSYGVNRLAIERGAYQAAIGTPGAGAASTGSMALIGTALFAATYTGLTAGATDQLRLEAYSGAQDTAIAQRIEAAQSTGRIAPLIVGLRDDFKTKAECERASSCLSGRGNGGEGPVYAAALGEAQKADAVAMQVVSGTAQFETLLGELRSLQLAYQDVIVSEELDSATRRKRAQGIAADVARTLAALQEAAPIAVVAAYGESLSQSITIPERPVASAKLNDLRAAYAAEIRNVVDSVTSSKVSLPVLPPRSGVSDALSHIGHFLPIALIVAAIEFVFPMLLWLTTYFSLLARVQREEDAPSQTQKKTTRSTNGGRSS